MSDLEDPVVAAHAHWTAAHEQLADIVEAGTPPLADYAAALDHRADRPGHHRARHVHRVPHPPVSDAHRRRLSRAGRARRLWLAARYAWYVIADRAVHRLGRPWNVHGGSGCWPCWHRDDVELERMARDRDWCQRHFPDVVAITRP